MRTYENYLNSVKAEIARSGMRKTDVAVLLGMDINSFSKRLNGSLRFSPENLIAMADIFGISLDQLVGRK